MFNSVEEEVEYYNNILSEETNEIYSDILDTWEELTEKDRITKLRLLIKQAKRDYTSCCVMGCKKESDYCFCIDCLHTIMKDKQCTHCNGYYSRDSICVNCPQCGKVL